MSKDYQCDESGMCSAECQHVLPTNGRVFAGNCAMTGRSIATTDPDRSYCTPWIDDRLASYELRKAERAMEPEVRTRPEQRVIVGNFPAGSAFVVPGFDDAVNSLLANGWQMRGEVQISPPGQNSEASICQALTREVPVEADDETDED